MFDATKSKFRNITFQQLDLDDGSNAELVSRYKVSGIPRLVFLDGSGNVLYNGGAFRDEGSFADAINQYR